MKIVRGVLLIATLLLTTSSSAFGQSNATARQHLESGLQLAEKGDWEQALVHFEEAHHLDPQPTTLYDVAQARQKTGRYRAAIEAYRALLVAKSSLSASQLATAQKQLAVAESRVGRITIAARSSEPADEITIDDQIVTRFPVLLDPGSHVARIRRAGAVVGERRIDLVEGAVLTVELEPQTPKAVSRDHVPTQPEKPPPSSSTTPAWIVLGSSAAVLIGGSIFAIRGYGAWSDLDDTCGPTKTCAASEVDSAQRDVLIGDIGVGVGVIGVAVGVVMLVSSSSSTKTGMNGYPLRW